MSSGKKKSQLLCPVCGGCRLKITKTEKRTIRVWRTRTCLDCRANLKTREEFHNLRPVDVSESTYRRQIDI